MAEQRIDTRFHHVNGADASLGDLVRQLATDTGELVRQEVALAKTEMREISSTVATDARNIGIGAVIALAGMLALTAFLILLLGVVLGNYWLSALVVGLLFTGIGAMLAKRAVDDIKQRGLKPDATMQTLREDAAWAKREKSAFKRELTK